MTNIIASIDPQDEQFQRAIVALWNAACGPDFAISAPAAAFNTAAATDVTRAAWLARNGEQPVGFVLASVWRASPALGWVDAIAVAPDQQRQGSGAALIAQAEAWLRAQSCTRARLGGSLRPFAPGLPLELATTPFFQQHGYIGERVETDVARDLRTYQTPAGIVTSIDARLVQSPEDSAALLEFFARAFPGRWEYEAQEHVRGGGPPSDFLALWQHGRIEGFCYTTSAGSFRPIDRFFMHRLPQPWGQLGPLGVSQAVRGQGNGVALIDAALRRLRDQGVAGCVIDWTNLLDLYAKFGFAPLHDYQVRIKELGT